MSEAIVHTTTLHRDDIPKMLEVAEEVQKEADIEQQTQVIIYQQRIEDIQRRLQKLREKISLTESLLTDCLEWKDWTKQNGSRWNESAMRICQLLSDSKNSLLKQREALFAQLDGYSEFIRKLENNEQLEFNL